MSNFEGTAPFDLPYEHLTGVPLNFNFWIGRNFIETETDVTDLIVALLVGDKPRCMKRSCDSEHPVKVVLAVAQGVDTSAWTGKNIGSSKFFSQCSTVPLNQQEKSDSSAKFSRGQPTDTIYNTLLWPEKPPCSFEDIKLLHSMRLFSDYALTFQVNRTICISQLLICAYVLCNTNVVFNITPEAS